jgi:hypothetical protein
MRHPFEEEELMPRHIRLTKRVGKRYEELVQALTQELLDPRGLIQPIIFEDPTEETQTLRVQVVWQEWHDLSHEVRTGIILDAYEKAYSAERRHQITLALGFDFDEAWRLGLVPVSLRPSLHGNEGISQDEYRQAMRDVGAVMEMADAGPMLWFASVKDAEVVKEQLEQILPHSKWTIVEERYRE